ncbi:MAG: NAD(P)/FAD-dependent oxidoreductase, partial [Clostridia bacterium]|nr:NAD(P)/FAD-dependent oxidoreductase [Clostridia bacterium]
SVGLIPENELSREAGIVLDPMTSGPKVNDSMETSMEGVFACGNVVQVHDLVDYVTQEASLAGRCAAEYVLHPSDLTKQKTLVQTLPGKGIRYIVPQNIEAPLGITGKEVLKLFFRVDNVYEKVTICVSQAGEVLSEIKKRKVSPGEMEQLVLREEQLKQLKTGAPLEICIMKGGQS